MSAGDMVEQCAEGGRPGRQGNRFAETVRGGETPGQQPDGGRLDIALAAGDLACEAKARPAFQLQVFAEQDRRIQIGVAVQAAETREFGMFSSPGIMRKISPCAP